MQENPPKVSAANLRRTRKGTVFYECFHGKRERKPAFDFRQSCVRERQTDKQRDGEDERGDIIWPWKQAILQSTFQTGGSLDQNRQTGTLGGIFQSRRHGKKFICYFSKQKMKTEFQTIANTQSHNRMFPLIVAMVNMWLCTFGVLLGDSFDIDKTPGSVHTNIFPDTCVSSMLKLSLSSHVQILDEVERRRGVSAALVYPFMRSLMESPFPAPGKIIKVKTFLPGAGNEVRAFLLSPSPL